MKMALYLFKDKEKYDLSPIKINARKTSVVYKSFFFFGNEN